MAIFKLVSHRHRISQLRFRDFVLKSCGNHIPNLIYFSILPNKLKQFLRPYIRLKLNKLLRFTAVNFLT